jgi:hypothetical protein
MMLLLLGVLDRDRSLVRSPSRVFAGWQGRDVGELTISIPFMRIGLTTA